MTTSSLRYRRNRIRHGLVAGLTTATLLISGAGAGAGMAAASPAAAPTTVTPSTSSFVAGDEAVDTDKLAEIYFKIQDKLRPSPKTIPASEVKMGVALFLYHPEVGLYTAKECKVDRLTNTQITINIGCPYDPRKSDVLIAQFYRTLSGQISKMAFYRAGYVVRAIPGRTDIKRVQGDLPLVAQTPPDPAPTRVTFK
ncbi:MAG: hypothetical protein WAN89_04215 [Lawsonella sp.]